MKRRHRHQEHRLNALTFHVASRVSRIRCTDWLADFILWRYMNVISVRDCSTVLSHMGKSKLKQNALAPNKYLKN